MMASAVVFSVENKLNARLVRLLCTNASGDGGLLHVPSVAVLVQLMVKVQAGLGLGLLSEN